MKLRILIPMSYSRCICNQTRYVDFDPHEIFKTHMIWMTLSDIPPLEDKVENQAQTVEVGPFPIRLEVQPLVEKRTVLCHPWQTRVE